MLHKHNLPSPKQLFRNNNTPNRIPGTSARITNNMRITKPDPKRRGRIDTRIHTSQNKIFFRRRQGKMTRCEGRSVGFIGGLKRGLDLGHLFVDIG